MKYNALLLYKVKIYN